MGMQGLPSTFPAEEPRPPYPRHQTNPRGDGVKLGVKALAARWHGGFRNNHAAMSQSESQEVGIGTPGRPAFCAHLRLLATIGSDRLNLGSPGRFALPVVPSRPQLFLKCPRFPARPERISELNPSVHSECPWVSHQNGAPGGHALPFA